MMQRLFRTFVLVAVVVLGASAAPPVLASFHLFVIDEVYSDASGNVQYVRLSTSAGNQQFIGGHTLTASQSSATHVYTFPANLPGDTTMKKFLVATVGFASLGLVTPDYTVPNGFLFQPGGSIDFGGVSAVTYGALPTDGTHAINAAGAVVVAAPTNFAGTSSGVNVPPPAQAGPMDIDQNGQVDALTDGLLLLRYMFGLRGASLVQGLIGQGAARNTAALIEAYLATCIAGVGSNCAIP